MARRPTNGITDFFSRRIVTQKSDAVQVRASGNDLGRSIRLSSALRRAQEMSTQVHRRRYDKDWR